MNNPEHVAAFVCQIVSGQLQVPEPEDGIRKGKILNLLDSGSSIHAASHAKHYKGATLKNRHKKTGYHAANGSPIKTEGEIEIPFTVNEGHDGTVTYINANVDMPILSTNGLAKDQNRISYEEHDGEILHKPTGRISRFVCSTRRLLHLATCQRTTSYKPQIT